MTEPQPHEPLPWFAGDKPRRMHFFVPLPDALDLPDQAEFHRVVRDVRMGIVRDALPYLEEPPGDDVDLDGDIYALVRLIFHRVRGRTMDVTPLARTAEAALRRLGQSEESLASLRSVTSETAAAQSGEGWWTIAELVLEDYGLVPHYAEEQRVGRRADWFMLSLDALERFIIAYRIASKSPIRDVNYTILPPVVFVVVANPADDSVSPVARMYTLNTTGQTWVEVDVEEQPERDVGAHVERLLERLDLADPLLVHTDRMWRAQRAIDFDGDYDSAVLHAAIATESRLVSTWLYLQWEKGLPAQQALASSKQLGGRKPIRTILAWLAQDLGGQWTTDGNPVLKAWVDGLMPLRNQIAHTGVRATRDTALFALNASHEVERFLSERLVDRWPVFPRTAVLSVGHLRIRERYGDERVDQFFESTRDEPFYAQAYAAWRIGGEDSN